MRAHAPGGEAMKITPYHGGYVPSQYGRRQRLVRPIIAGNERAQLRASRHQRTGTENSIWELPGNVARRKYRPPVGADVPAPGRPRTAKALCPVLELFLHSLATDNHGERLRRPLRQLSELARAGELAAAMSSKDAVGLLMGMPPGVQRTR